MNKVSSLIETFYSKIDASAGDEGCHPWTGTKGNGYGRLTNKGTYVYTHRFMWELHNGPIPSGMVICHKCDNPICCNIVHLFIGTPKDNTQDAKKKGRLAKGIKHGSNILSEDQVIAIFLDPRSSTQTAKDYGINRRHVSDIRNKTIWASITDGLETPSRPTDRYCCKLTKEDVLCIKHLLDEGHLSLKEIGEQFGVYGSTIAAIRDGRSWNNL